MNDLSSVASQRMQCMEIVGGNRSTNDRFEAPGLDVYVHSSAYGTGQNGGDIYYLTSCASGRITRLLLADVSGHGDTASKLAISLRDLMRANVNRISQERFVEGMNREFGKVADETGFATAAVVTFFQPRKTVSIGLAGHPYPLYYHAAKQEWVILHPQASRGPRLANLPLGVTDKSRYPGQTLNVQPGDMFLLYSDAFSEAIRRDGGTIGTQGIVDILSQLRQPDAAQIIPHLYQSIREESISNLTHDDATLILGHVNPSKTRLVDNLMAPFRLLRQVRDKSGVDAPAVV